MAERESAIWSHSELESLTLAQLCAVRDSKSDELLRLQRDRYSLIAQIEHLQHLIDAESDLTAKGTGHDGATNRQS